MLRGGTVVVWGLGMCLALSGCNMPTPPSQIPGAYRSGIAYEQYDCSRLAAELYSLTRRERQLAAAQQERIASSRMQAFWWGYGKGDGMEASELSQVRGEKEAVLHAMDVKHCPSASGQ